MKHLFNREADRLVAIKLFKHAKTLIRNRSEDFVCLAVLEADIWVRDVFENASRVSAILREEIDNRIHPCGTVSAWLHDKHDVTWTFDSIRDYRIRWIDSMIKELK